VILNTTQQYVTTVCFSIYLTTILLLLLLLLAWRYNSGRFLAFSTISFHLRRSWTCSVHFMSFIFFRLFLTSSSHRDLCLLLVFNNTAMIFTDTYNKMTKLFASIALKMMWKKRVLGGLRQHCGIFVQIFSPHIAQQLSVGQGLLLSEASRSHSDIPHSVGLLWTSDRPAADTSTCTTHATLTTDKHPCPQ